MFFGTPHRGSKHGSALAFVKKISDGLSNCIGITELAKMLKHKLPELDDLHQRFLRFARRFVVKSFHETVNLCGALVRFTQNPHWNHSDQVVDSDKGIGGDGLASWSRRRN